MPIDVFAKVVRELGVDRAARKLGINRRTVQRRRDSIERESGAALYKGSPLPPEPTQFPWRRELKIPNGIVIVASDSHYWPGPTSLMHRALVFFCKELKPRAIIENGDVIDAPTISRHAPIGWEGRPNLCDEIEAAQDRLAEVEKAAGKAERIWNLGNHDARFETRLATVAPEYAMLYGVHLKDHFPLWDAAWSCWINDQVVVKHRFKGGDHAPWNNTLRAGKTMVTGHLHSAKVIPLSDYTGTRYGVDTGCIAEPNHKAFVDYTEDNPKNWRSAFAVLTFKDGKLMYPELVTQWDDDRVQFRGTVFTP